MDSQDDHWIFIRSLKDRGNGYTLLHYDMLYIMVIIFLSSSTGSTVMMIVAVSSVTGLDGSETLVIFEKHLPKIKHSKWKSPSYSYYSSMVFLGF